MALAWRIPRPAHDKNPWHHRLDDAVTLIRGCHLDDALRLVDDLIANAEDDASVLGRAHSFRGEIASIRGELNETMTEYAKAISHLETTELFGSLARAHRGRADGYFNLAMYSSALEDSHRARLLVDSITDERVRMRAALESALCEGLIRIELNQADLGRRLWESSEQYVDDDCDPLLVGLHHLLGGLALSASAATQQRGFDLIQRAGDHFAAYGLIYYRARTLEAHARRLVSFDRVEAVELGEEAGRLYKDAGATLRQTRVQQWLDNIRPQRRPVLQRQVAGPRLSPAAEEIDGIILAGPSTRACVEMALCAAASGSTVLITGESGTGKELVARVIHKRSQRSHRPLVPFNCAAVPSELIESVLFGHKRGAFTGANVAHDGLVRAADTGTLFLDELGEMPLQLQAKLLRFLQEGEVLPIGETRPVRVDVRIIAATNRDLERDTRDGSFRADLYHRLNVIRIPIAPLRERPEEIPTLARKLAAAIGDRVGHSNVEVTAGAIGAFLDYHWPGNVRELGNLIERSLAMYGPRLTRASIEASLGKNGDDPYSSSSPSVETRFEPASVATTVDLLPLAKAMDIFERAYIERIVTETAGNRTRAAQRLEVSLQRLRYRMRRLGMD